MPAGPAPEYAPFGGIVPNVVLQPGTRVNTGTAVMALIDSANPIINVQIAQNHLRYIRPGQEAEVTFPLYPGSTYPAKVTKIYRANVSGQLQPSGLVASVNESGTERFNVTLTLEGPAPELPIGASGTAAIYTTEFTASHLFRRVILRMTAWLNFIMAG